MLQVLADFHVHTLLSPCAEVEMTPHHILLRAAEFGIGAVAITDHNASANVAAAMELSEKYGVKVFPGMEVECAEEAHLVVLFDTLEQLASWQAVVDKHMNGMMNDADKFGAQYVVDAEDELVQVEERMLLAPLSLTAAQVVEHVTALGGLVLAAHVDKPAYSLVGQLGFIEPDSGLAAAEISTTGWRNGCQARWQRLTGFLPFVTDSDAHNILDFIQGPKNLLTVEELTVAEVRKALQGMEGRSLVAGKFSDYLEELL
ncbi:PHP domain-containing protein [Phascolarctobacterium sp.]|uniref:PHP domain-containing protein n=1 Tax=Phascolarctobacterium sp. TaxID=2049039 RepID=UPI003862DD6D